MYRFFILGIFFPCFLSAQPEWGAFQNLVNKTWEAEGKWGDGSSFKQSVHFTFELDQNIIVAKSKGFIDKAQSQLGDRNYGIRKYDPIKKNFVFYEFDVFGGVTEGELILEEKNIVYQYQYGTSMLTDMWEYVNDSTYKFIVGEFENGTWSQKYLETTFIERASIISKIKKHLTGKWISKAWDGVLEESWYSANGRWVQNSVYSENGKIIYEANSFIEEKANELILTTVIKNSSPKIFKATKIGEDTITFENTDYKNPSIVIYKFYDNNHFERTIQGIENEEESSYTFNFRKQI